MADYFESVDKIPVQQTSISIPSENGLTYNSAQIIEINVPASTKFINPKESYLQFNVKVSPPSDTSGSLTKLQLDGEIGANILIRDIRIYDGNRNTLLEEITDYNTMVAMKYDYESNPSIRNKRSLTEGCTMPIPQGRGTRGSTDTYLNQQVNNPYYKSNAGDDPNQVAQDSDQYVNAKVTLPLHTGLFQNDKILPVMLLQGLHISITLEEDRKVFRMLDSVALGRRTTLNPIFHSINGCATTGAWASGSATTSVYLSNQNNQWETDDCPFSVGEAISFHDMVGGTSASFTGSAFPIITEIDTNLTYIRLTFASIISLTGVSITTDGAWCVESKSVEASSTFTPTYQISNVELVLQSVTVDNRYEQGMIRKMKEGGQISYDFLSVTNYKYSQLVSDRVANIRLPLDNSRAKSILCVPSDASVYTSQHNITGNMAGNETYILAPTGTRDFYSYSCRSGMIGCSDNLTNYVFQYNGKLQPSRLVDCSKTASKVSISQQHLIELDKALTSAGINTHSMRNYSNNFIIGRALALGSGVYDARNRDFNLQVNYQESSAPTKPHLWKCYVYHIRRLNIKGESISIDI